MSEVGLSCRLVNHNRLRAIVAEGDLILIPTVACRSGGIPPVVVPVVVVVSVVVLVVSVVAVVVPVRVVLVVLVVLGVAGSSHGPSVSP